MRRRVSFHDTQLGKDVKHAYQALAIDERRRPFQPDLWTGNPAPRQTIQQIWFAGVHSNVGGSYRNTGLSDIALKWLAWRSAFHGLEFTDEFKRFLVQRPQAIGKIKLENSFSLGYQALRGILVSPYTREIGPKQHGDIRRPGVPVPGERVHYSAAAAIRQSFDGMNGAPYMPKNLIRALADGLRVWP